jgi:Flp pilus assembly protein TadG
MDRSGLLPTPEPKVMIDEYQRRKCRETQAMKQLQRGNSGARGLARTIMLAAVRFRADETGTMTFFSMMLIILIFMCGGMGVDLMRHERMRSAIQNTSDEAVLAAANLDQTLDPTTVVNDYFAKAGMTSYLTSVNVTTASNARTVTVNTTASLPTYFMKLEGVQTLAAKGVSQAVESIGNVEVAIALDNSGSMTEAAGSTTKIQALITAANSFVDQMFSQVESGALTMSLLPYDSHIDIGNTLMANLNVSSENTVAKCIDFLPGDFNTTAVSATALLQRSGNFDGRDTGTTMVPECNSHSYRDSVVFSNNPTTLHSLINSLQAGGYTSIDSGVKWASATLDPSFQPVVNNLISAGTLTSAYAGRPAAFNDRNFMKVLIVMTDGENTTRMQLNPGYYSGNSGYFTTGTSTYWSFYDSTKGTTPYFWKYDKKWHASNYYKGASSQPCTSSCSNYTVTDSKAATTATQWTWPQIWAKWPVQYFTNNIIGTVYGSSASTTWYNKIVSTVSATTMDSLLHNICTAAKANGVLIYAIGFQTTSHGAAVLTDCATSPAFYFDAQGTQISTVFSAIASSIVHLRLTQ